MDNPQITVYLYRIHHPKGVSPKPQGYLKNTRPHAFHRLGYIGLATLSRDSQSSQTNLLSTYREILKLFPSRLQP